MRLNTVLCTLSSSSPGGMTRPGCWALVQSTGRVAGFGAICGSREESSLECASHLPLFADLVLVYFSGGEKHIPSGGSDRARNR